MIQNRKHQWKFLAFILVVLLLGCMPAEADPLYDGFIVSPWVYEGITYYRVYSNPEEIMGAPTFYTEERDQYNNIYTNWDVKITFYRQYDGATLEQADAFCQYLMANSSEKNRYAGYYYYGDSYSPEIFVYLFEGWQIVCDAVSGTWPGCIVSPYLMVQCSDSRHYGLISDRVYRFSAMDMSAEERHMIHGNDERIRLEAICRAVEFFMRVMKQL